VTASVGHVLAASLLSGAGALGLQLAWTRRLAVPLGHEMPASLAVISVFFVGMALGARFLQPTHHPRSRAVWLELAIAGWAWISIPWMDVLARHLPDALGPTPSAVRFCGVAGLATLLALLPATAAMGATFAALERTAAAAGAREPIPWIYGTNTVGAALGVALSLALFQPTLGLGGATFVAGLFHLLAALLLIRVANPVVALSPTSAPTPNPTPSAQPGALPALAWLALGGFVGIGSEVVLIRLLAPVLGGTIYTHGLVLAMWLTGTALGSWVGIGWFRRLPDSAPALANVMGLAISAAFLGWIALPLLEQGREWGTGFKISLAFEFLVVLAVVLPVSIPGGAWFTHWLQSASSHGVATGSAIAINTLAAAFAPVVWIGLLLPALGETSTWFTLAALAALAALLMGPSSRRLTLAISLPALAALATSNLQLLQPPPAARLVRAWCGPSDSVAVWEWPDRSRSLAVNNRFTMGGTASAPAAARHAHLPLLLHPNPNSALFLGLGTGISFAAAGAHPGLQAHGIELVPEVVDALPQFSPFNSLSPNLHVFTADARRFLRADRSPYDVIVADLFHPERDGAAWLYTREHFSALRSRLAPGGVACQWLPWFQLDAPTRHSIVQAWLDNFPDSDAWLLRWTTLDTPVVGLISGLHGPPRSHPSQLDSRLSHSHLRESLKRSALTDGWQLWGGWVGPARSLIPQGTRPDPNTDDHPRVAWMAAHGVDRARLQFREDLLQWLKDCQPHHPPGWPLADLQRWRAFRTARDQYLSALFAEISGNQPLADQQLWASLDHSPDFPTAYSHWIGRALALSSTDPAATRRILTRLGDARPEQPLAKELLRRVSQADPTGGMSQE
jgi:spermidine synthase